MDILALLVISLFGPGGEMLVYPGYVGPAHFLKLFLGPRPQFLSQISFFKQSDGSLNST